MNQHEGSARPANRPQRGTRITRTLDLANPRLIGVWKWNFGEVSRRLYAICVFAPTVLREAYPLEELQHLKAYIEQQALKVENMIDWTRSQFDATGLQEGEPGWMEPLSADIRTPLAGAYADLFVRADLAIRLLDALWVQQALTDAGHEERTTAMRRAPLKILGETRKAHARCQNSIQALYRQRESSDLLCPLGSQAHPDWN